ncbi:flavodoxin family protein [Nordella sp. HKS 07]|uniref:flavodoxin family protein n=1 Tax=Nordella sp. HKS 07 TaxID=2712222 RepID=UPI0013E1F2B9|nr:flavodoxin family protein [Nordella sp. HKS 07]QIG50213.1 flavodoxin family protein [Nordella sp. HKS 07]
MRKVKVRKGMPNVALSKAQFAERFKARFYDPIFAGNEKEIDELLSTAWISYDDNHKSPRTRKAGKGFADPSYDLSVDWYAAHKAIRTAEREHRNQRSPSRILIINGSMRSDQSCPGEMSKSWRLVELARKTVMAKRGFEVDVLDLSRLASEYGRVIHPCKACVSTAMPLCHWPCSCYPNHALGQVNDWMNEIYPMWVKAHGIMIVTPVNWYQAPAGLKAMIDRLVCADGGNPDPTSTHGKNAQAAKALELKGWPYPRHLAGRLFSIVVHGDASGAENLRRILTDWLTDMGLIPAGHKALIDRYIGYYRDYATSHDDLDADRDLQEEVRNAARALVNAIMLHRKGRLKQPDVELKDPRPK